MEIENKKHRVILQKIARRVMVERGFYPDFSEAALAELQRIPGPARADGKAVRDMRDRLWASIDNDDSLDLDQLTTAETAHGDAVRLFVAIADVDALVKEGSAIDEHARYNTTSVYTAAEIFPMLPEELSTGLTSLNLEEDRLAVVVEMVVNGDGTLESSDIYRAVVHNQAKLAYNSVASWLDGNTPAPPGVTAVKGLAENLSLQDQAAHRLRHFRQSQGALSLETIESKPIFDGDEIRDLEIQRKNRAREFIEDMMIAANGITVRFLSSRNLPSIRRVVSIPKRWDRIAEIAREHGAKLPDTARSDRAGSFPHRPEGCRSAAFPRPVAGGDQTARVGRICRRESPTIPSQPLWPGGQRLHSLHRPEPPLYRSDHPTLAEISPEWGRRPIPSEELEGWPSTAPKRG